MFYAHSLLGALLSSLTLLSLPFPTHSAANPLLQITFNIGANPTKADLHI
jgi:hypothetical protein